jgi:hypothetical protein
MFLDGGVKLQNSFLGFFFKEKGFIASFNKTK